MGEIKFCVVDKYNLFIYYLIFFLTVLKKETFCVNILQRTCGYRGAIYLKFDWTSYANNNFSKIKEKVNKEIISTINRNKF